MVTIIVKVSDSLWQELEAHMKTFGRGPSGERPWPADREVRWSIRDIFGAHPGTAASEQITIDIKREV